MNKGLPLASVDQVSDSRAQARVTLLSHDIRSAMSDVIGGLRLVDLGALDEATRLQLERVRIAGESLARLIEEGFSVMAAELPENNALTSNLHLPRLLDNIELRWSARAREKGLAFDIRVPSNVPTMVATERLALERILANMLDNAIKYTDQGRVSLTIEVCAAQSLCFIVTDTGPGFSPEALEKLFQYRGRPSGTDKPGTGLGLHIVKDIADRLGGALRVDNRPEGGSRLEFSLPYSTWHFTSYLDSEGTLPDLTATKILLAEDNETNQLILAQMLDVMGAEYEIAADGVEALNWLERERFDLALIDIDMPRLSGIDVMKAVRSGAPGHRALPMMAITAFVLRANREAIYRAGANRILAKPILSIDAFGQALSALLRDAGLQAGPEAIALADLPPLDEDRFLHLLTIAGATGAMELLERLQRDLEKVQAAGCQATRDLDQAGLRAQTHVLISLAGAVGANRLQHLAEQLNTAAHHLDGEAILALWLALRGELAQLLARVEKERLYRNGEAPA